MSIRAFSQMDVIKSIEYFTQVIDGDSKESPFLIKRETYNDDFKLILTEIYTKDNFLLSQKRVYDEQGLLTERLGYSLKKDKVVFTGKTRYYYDEAHNLTRMVDMNRLYYLRSRMDFSYNKKNEKIRRKAHFYHRGNALLSKVEDFWFLSVVSAKARFKYEYFPDRTEITENAKRPKQKLLWIENKKGQLLGLFWIENKQRRRMIKVTYNAQGQKTTSTFYALSNNPVVIGITGQMKLDKGDKLTIETSYLDHGLVDGYKQYLNGELNGIQTLKYIY